MKNTIRAARTRHFSILLSIPVLFQAFFTPSVLAGTLPSPDLTPSAPSGQSVDDLQGREAARGNLIDNRNEISELSYSKPPFMGEADLEIPDRGYHYSVAKREFAVTQNGVTTVYHEKDFVHWFSAGQAMLRFANEVSDPAEAERIVDVLNRAMSMETYVTTPGTKVPAFGKYGRMIVATDHGSGYYFLDTQTGNVYQGNYTPNAPGFSRSSFEEGGKYLAHTTEMLASVFLAQNVFPAADQASLQKVADALKPYLGIETISDTRSGGNLLGRRAFDKNGKQVVSYTFAAWPYLSQLNVHDRGTGQVIRTYVYDPKKADNPLVKIIVRIPGRGYSFDLSTKTFTFVNSQGISTTYGPDDFIRWFSAGQAMLRFAGELSDPAETGKMIDILNKAMSVEIYVASPGTKLPAFGKYGRMIVATDHGSGYYLLDTQTGSVYQGNYTPDSPGFSKSSFEGNGKYLFLSTETMASVFFAQTTYPAADQASLQALAGVLRGYLGIWNIVDVRSSGGSLTARQVFGQNGKLILSYKCPSWPALTQLDVYNPATGKPVKTYVYDPARYGNPLTMITAYYASGYTASRIVYDVSTGTRTKVESYDTAGKISEASFYDAATGGLKAKDVYYPGISKVQTHYDYDGNGHLLHTVLFNPQGARLLEYFYMPGSTSPYKLIYYVNGVPYTIYY